MKQNLITEQKVFDEVKKAIVVTLRVDEKEIKPESSLIRDLGAESLDFLDINYRLEQTFGIKMARHFILEHVEETFGEGSAIDENGQLTDKGVALLQLRFGGEGSDFTRGMDMDLLPALITVQLLTRGVMDILDSLPDTCPQCGKRAWKTEDGAKITCGSCGESAPFTNGDDLIRQWLTAVQEKKQLF